MILDHELIDIHQSVEECESFKLKNRFKLKVNEIFFDKNNFGTKKQFISQQKDNETLNIDSIKIIREYFRKIIEIDPVYYNDKCEQIKQVEEEIIRIHKKGIKEGRMCYDEDGKFKHATSLNGEISNLDEWTWLVTKTNRFQKYYKGPRDDMGEPILTWHGTKDIFHTYDPNQNGKNKDFGYFGQGIYLTEFKGFAERHGPIVMPLFANIQNYITFHETDKNVRFNQSGEKDVLDTDRKIITGEHFPLQIEEDINSIFKGLFEVEIKRCEMLNKESSNDMFSFPLDAEDSYEMLLALAVTLASKKQGATGNIACNPVSQLKEFVVFDSNNIKSPFNLFFCGDDDNIYH